MRVFFGLVAMLDGCAGALGGDDVEPVEAAPERPGPVAHMADAVVCAEPSTTLPLERAGEPARSPAPFIVEHVDGGQLAVQLRQRTLGEDDLVARGAFAVEPAGEGWQVGWKSLTPLHAVEVEVSLPDVERVWAVTVVLEYWGGAGAGLITDDHRVVYLVGLRDDRLDLLYAAVYGEDWVEYPTCPEATNDCMENAQGQPRGWRAALTVDGCASAPGLRLFAPDTGARMVESRWSAEAGHFVPLYASL